jgi:hypothetical protein
VESGTGAGLREVCKLISTEPKEEVMVSVRRFNSVLALPCAAALTAVVIGGLAPGLALAAPEQLTISYSFEQPQISQVTIAGQQYHRVTIAGCSNVGNAGQPSLPASGARILLPMGTQVSGITVTPGERVLLGSDYLVEPVEQAVRLSENPIKPTPPTPDPAIY